MRLSLLQGWMLMKEFAKEGAQQQSAQILPQEPNHRWDHERCCTNAPPVELYIFRNKTSEIADQGLLKKRTSRVARTDKDLEVLGFATQVPQRDLLS